MIRLIPTVVLLIVCSHAALVSAAPVPAPAGSTEWRFTGISGSIVDSAYGPGTMTQVGIAGDVFSNTTAQATVPDIGPSPANILMDNTAGAGAAGYQVESGVTGGGSGHLQFTMIWDMFVQSSNTDSYLAMYQGSATNANDADLFIRPDTGGFYVGGTGSFGAGSWSKGVWNRIAVRVDWNSGTLDLFVNGSYITTVPPNDFVYSNVDNGLPFWIFTDNNGEDSTSAVSAFAFVPTLLTDNDLLTLGGASAAGILIPSPAALPAGLALLMIGAARRRRN